MRVARIWALSILLTVGMGPLSLGWAQTSAPPAEDRVDAAMGRYNLHPAIEKLSRGVANALGGWLEVPLNIGQRYSASDTAGSLFSGTVYGLVKGVVRTGVGLYETVTFLLPYPENFAPILPTLEYYQHTTKRQPLLLE